MNGNTTVNESGRDVTIEGSCDCKIRHKLLVNDDVVAPRRSPVVDREGEGELLLVAKLKPKPTIASTTEHDGVY